MSAPASPPLSVWEQPGLDAGAKLAWLGLRSFATFGDDGEVFVWPSRAGLARRIGAKPEAVKKQVARLTKMGLVTRASRRIDGADRDGWVVSAGEHRPRGEQLPRGTQVPAQGTTLPAPGEAVPQARVLQAPYTLQDQSNYQSSEGDAPAPATHESDPHVRDHAANPHGPDLEAKADAPGLPGLRGRRGQPTTVRSDDAFRVGEEGILPGVTDGAPVVETPEQANPQLGSRLEAHRARIESHPPKASRVELTPAVHAAVVAARMSTSLEASVWVRCMLETLDDFGIGEGYHAAMVARVLAAWTSGERARPAKSQLWYRKHRDWQREAMGLGKVKRSGGMSGGIVAARPMPDWDAQAAERRAST